MDNVIHLSPNHWLYLFAGLSEDNKKYLSRYYGTIYPRSYVRKLIATLEEEGVQYKSAQDKEYR